MIGSIATPEIQEVLIRIANVDGHKTKARHLRAMLGEVFMYAIAKKECDRNPAAGALFKLPKITTRQLAAIISPSEVGELSAASATYDGRIFTRAALEVMARRADGPPTLPRWSGPKSSTASGSSPPAK